MIRINIGFCTIVGTLLFATLNLQAQTKKDAVDAYNQGVATMSTNVDSAIIYFEKSVELSNKVGDEALDVYTQSTKVLPSLYFQRVKDLAKEKKIPEAITASKEAIKVAEKYKNENVKQEEILKYEGQLYVALGNMYYSKPNETDNAIKAYDSALVINPNNYRALFNKALVLRKQEKSDTFQETIDLAITKADTDTAMVTQYKKVARDYFKSAGTKANTSNKLTEAIKDLTTSLKYGVDKDVMYQFANLYNKQKKWDEALTNAQKGLEMETGTNEAKAKFHYEIAVAQAGKGDKDAACASFKDAQFGIFAVPSKAQMQNMKCAGAAPASAATK